MFDFPKVRPVGKQKQNDPLGHHPQGDKNSLRPLLLILGFFAIASAGVILFALFQKLGPEASAAPGIYKTLNYQGKLEDVDGITVADGAYNIKFTIHDAAAAGNVLWTARESDACGAPFNPSAKSVTTKLGVFSTQLGESGDCPINLDFNTDSYYFGVTIGADSEMTPRKRIGAAGYAFNADLLDGISEEYFGQLAQDETVTGFWTFNNNVDVNQHLALATNASVDSKIVLKADETYSGGPLNTEPNYYYGIYNKTTGQVNPGTCNGGKPHTCSLSYYGLYNDITTNGSYGLASLTGLSNQVTLGGSDTITNLYGMSIQVSQNSTTGSTSGSGLYVNIGEGGYGGTLDSAYGGQFYSVVATYNTGVWGSAQGDELTSVSSHGVYGYATGATSDNYGVYGYATGNTGTGYGGYFDTTRPGGYGVYGRAEDTSIANYGGYFRSEGAGGYGVYGWASDAGAVGANYGGYFTAAGTGAATAGVRGIASAAAAGTTFGVWGSTASTNPASSGVYGTASAAASVYGVAGNATDTGAAVTNYGGWFSTSGGTGVGVYGQATYLATATTNYGGYFTAAGTSFASGVYGEATGAGTVYGVSGTASNSGAVMNTGGFFRSSGTGAGASGVRGYAYGAANDVYGVYGQANSTGVYTNYGGFFLAQGQTGRGVFGTANATGAVTNYGGYFTAAGGTGVGVFGASTAAAGASGIGGRFEVAGTGGASAVSAVSTGATGNNYGIYSNVISVTGWSGYFQGGRGIYTERLAINDAISSVAYNTIGTAAATHVAAGEIGNASDLFIADDLEVDGQSWFDGGHVDIAEMVVYSGEGEAGDVVVVDENIDNAAKIATKPYDQSVLGIISTKPSLIITGDIKEGKLLAVAGRVPTKVTNANGAIHRGDLLTTSSMPGRAMKATEPGPIVGKAMGKCNESECTIWVFLNVSWYGGVRTETTAAEVSPVIEDAKNLDRDNILDRITDFWKKLFQ